VDEVDVILVYNEFKSAMTQKVTFEPLLPIVDRRRGGRRRATPRPAGSASRLIYEPNAGGAARAPAADVRRDLGLPRHARVQRERARRPHDRDGQRDQEREEMIGALTLEYNRARQAAITKELMEIIGGAEALKG
jgi:F-type H+-transporting ATPase subunit gamma